MPKEIQALIDRLEYLARVDKSDPSEWFLGQKTDYLAHARALRELYATRQ